MNTAPEPSAELLRAEAARRAAYMLASLPNSMCDEEAERLFRELCEED